MRRREHAPLLAAGSADTTFDLVSQRAPLHLWNVFRHLSLFRTLGISGSTILAFRLPSESLEEMPTIDAHVILRKYGFHAAQVDSTAAISTHSAIYVYFSYMNGVGVT